MLPVGQCDLYFTVQCDLHFTVQCDLYFTVQWFLCIKYIIVLLAKRSSGELCCPATALITICYFIRELDHFISLHISSKSLIDSTQVPLLHVRTEHPINFSNKEEGSVAVLQAWCFMWLCQSEWAWKYLLIYKIKCNFTSSFRDGYSKSGVYCALNICCEQLESEREVDVFNAVRLVKQNRPHLVPTVVSNMFWTKTILLTVTGFFCTFH